MKKIVMSVVAAAALAVAGVVAGGGMAKAQSTMEYCVAGGGQVVVKFNSDHEMYYQCQGGRFDGYIIGQPIA